VSDIATASGVAQGLALGLARESQLLSRVAPQGDLHGSDKIEKAAKDFESILLGHWLEEAQESLASAPGGSGDDDDDPTRIQFQGLGMQSLATAITQSGGIGIAAMITRQLHRLDAEAPGSPQPPGRDSEHPPDATSMEAPARREKSAK